MDTSKVKEDLDSLCMQKLSKLTGDEIKTLVPIVKSKDYADYAKDHSKEEIEEYLFGELELYRQKKMIDERSYVADKEFMKKVVSQQRKETIEKTSLSFKDKVSKWLHHGRENDKDKLGEKGE